MNDFLQRLSSRKFLLAFLFAVLVFVNRYFDLGLTQSELGQIAKTVIAYILGEGAADVVSRFKDKG